MDLNVKLDEDIESAINGLTDALTTVPKKILIQIDDEAIRALNSIADSLSTIARDFR